MSRLLKKQSFSTLFASRLLYLSSHYSLVAVACACTTLRVRRVRVLQRVYALFRPLRSNDPYLTVALLLTSFVIRSVSRELVRCVVHSALRSMPSLISLILVISIKASSRTSSCRNVPLSISEAHEEVLLFLRWRNRDGVR